MIIVIKTIMKMIDDQYLKLMNDISNESFI